MSVPGAQPMSGDISSGEAALDSLFDKVLDSLKQIDIFSSSNHPIVFPVYAHDNPIAGTSHAWCVIQIIKWLEAAGCQVISDRTPLLPHHEPEDDDAAIRNILSSQFRLLPRDHSRQVAHEQTYANKVLVFTSEVLRQYCVNATAEQYVESVAKAYGDSKGQSRDHLKNRLRAMIEENARNGSGWFHHVLTEIAFMKLRRDHDCLDHGIIPVALDGDLPDYLPFVNPTDLVLKQEINSLYSSDLHLMFFKIIIQIYPEQHLPINKFKECYTTLKARLTGSGEAVIQNLSDAEVVKFVRQVYESILQQDQIATRQRLRDADSYQRIQQAQSGASGNTTGAELSRKRAFLSKLATLPYRDRKDRNPRRDKGTCEWFKRHSKFQEWQLSKKASLLWVSADPGCGKSVLSKYLVDEVLPTTGKQMTCYFFFKDDLEDQRMLVSSLRCMLHQLFEQNLSLLDIDLLSRFENDGQLLNSRTDLWRILIDIFRKQLVEYFVCVLDGFDECMADDRSFLLENLKKLYMKETAPPLKLLLTSRPYEDISRGLRYLQKKELVIHLSGESEQEMDKISREIDIVIQKNVDDLGEDLDLEPDVTDLIKNELTKVENRSYLWVSLMIEILKTTIETSKSALKTVIQQLPRTVSAAYEKILNREQNDETNAKTRRLLHIILAATEPLLTDELAVAFSMSEHASFNEREICRNTKFTREFSKLLVVIRNGRAYLAHQTVKEFLIMESPTPPENALLGPAVQWEHSFHPHHSHFVMAKSCMSYLEQCSPNRGVLLGYAARNWPEHFRMAGDVDEMLITKSRKLCDLSSEEFHPWFEEHWCASKWHYRYGPTYPTSLITATLLGLKETVRLLLNATNPDLDARDWTYSRTALFWACDNSYLSIMKLLLQAGANMRLKDSNRDTALHCAVKRGNLAVAKVLLKHATERDVDKCINSPGSYGKTPLTLAIEAPNKEIVELLLEYNADVNLVSEARDGGRVPFSDETPLALAVKNADTEILEVLLKHGAKLSSAPYGHTLLFQAASVGEYSAIEFLLGLNLAPQNGLPPLLQAITDEDEIMVDFLLDHGVDVDLAPPNGSMLLLRAVNVQNSSAVGFLLDRGVNINLAPPNQLTPLLQAIISENIDMVEFLLDRGADINLAPPNQLTPLLQAIISQDIEMVEFLTNHGADVNFVFRDGRTSLSLMISAGNGAGMKLLLDLGADIHARVKIDGRLPLSEAIRLQKDDLVKVLLDYGACVNDDSCLAEPPIIAAIKCGRGDIVRSSFNAIHECNPTDTTLALPIPDNIDWLLEKLKIEYEFGHGFKLSERVKQRAPPQLKKTHVLGKGFTHTMIHLEGIGRYHAFLGPTPRL